MRACPTCSGFVPDHLPACPHCGTGSRFRRLARALARLAGSGAALATLAACYGAPPYIDTCPDGDGDGWTPGCYNDDLSCDVDDLNCDCNDADSTINPGQVDLPDDGIDSDCDGKDTQRPGGPLYDAAVPVDAGDPWAPDGGDVDAVAGDAAAPP